MKKIRCWFTDDLSVMVSVVCFSGERRGVGKERVGFRKTKERVSKNRAISLQQQEQERKKKRVFGVGVANKKFRTTT
jgi:hypothetical protein